MRGNISSLRGGGRRSGGTSGWRSSIETNHLGSADRPMLTQVGSDIQAVRRRTSSTDLAPPDLQGSPTTAEIVILRLHSIPLLQRSGRIGDKLQLLGAVDRSESIGARRPPLFARVGFYNRYGFCGQESRLVRISEHQINHQKARRDCVGTGGVVFEHGSMGDEAEIPLFFVNIYFPLSSLPLFSV